jgi:hypothetical protein
MHLELLRSGFDPGLRGLPGEGVAIRCATQAGLLKARRGRNRGLFHMGRRTGERLRGNRQSGPQEEEREKNEDDPGEHES